MSETRQPSIADAINWEHAAEFSYSAYHAEAIDYVCLFRSTALTLKAYFFDEGSNDEVVVPHTHRYDFDTRVIAGSLEEVRYELGPTEESNAPVARIRYRYNSIVEGGSGFAIAGASIVWEYSADHYSTRRGCDRYSNRAHTDIHTLRSVEPGTILLLTQYADRGPAYTFAWSDSQPNTGGIYRRMERPEIEKRVERLQSEMAGEVTRD